MARKNEDSENIFKPLRKKHCITESNDVPSVYKQTVKGNAMVEDDVEEFRLYNGIKVKGIDCPAPIKSFTDLNLDPKVVEYLKNENFFCPTPIQMQTISCALSGRDIIGLAETGSGKTLAYLLPLAILLKRKPARVSGELPLALIVTPTRELTQQIYKNIEKLLYGLTFDVERSQQTTTICYKAASITGGTSLHSQAVQIETGIDILVCTPGRLIDLCDRGILSLYNISYFVMDEVDRMLGMGLEEQLRKIVALVTVKQQPCQTLLFSATLPESLERLARSAVINPIEIEVGTLHVTAPNISHHVIFLHSYEKPLQILDVLRKTHFPPVIVFASSITSVDFLVRFLRKEQFHVSGLHSEKTQDYRFRLVAAVKAGKVDVLVATDLASRGLDIPEVTHIINYDMPDTIEDYIHRCGRTGRLARHGEATSFLTLKCKIAAELRELLDSLEQEIPKELDSVKQFGKNVVETEFGDRTT